MSHVTIDMLQALQLVGLLPSVFLVCLLMVLTSHYTRIVIPVAFFASLICSFLIPLSSLVGENSSMVQVGLHIAQDFQPALCFLLVVQFLSAAVPPKRYWLVLLVPVIGSVVIVHSFMTQGEFCVLSDYCVPADAARKLYNVLAASVIFLLLMYHILRNSAHEQMDPIIRRHKYWLVMVLVFLNLMLLVNDLAFVSDDLSLRDNLMIAAVLRVSFIYLVITSLFRVFDRSKPFGVDSTSLVRKPREADPALIAKLVAVMEEDKLYRESGLSREDLAQRLEVGEQTLSHAINQQFDQNFNEFINSYRIEEAKERLVQEKVAVTVIAFEVGFNSIASFNRVFKALVGSSPSEYRSGQSDAATEQVS